MSKRRDLFVTPVFPFREQLFELGCRSLGARNVATEQKPRRLDGPAPPSCARPINDFTRGPEFNCMALSRAAGVIFFQDYRSALIILSSAVFTARSAAWNSRKTRHSASSNTWLSGSCG